MTNQIRAETLKQFREELYTEGILHDGDTIGTNDDTLVRFLRARRFDLVQAKKMFRDCQQWRKAVEGVGIDELYSRIDPFDYPEREAIFGCWPMWYHKTDKQGRPLNIQIFGNVDLNKLYNHCTPQQHWQTLIVNAESLSREILPAAGRKAGKEVEGALFILDLQDFGLSKFWQMKSLIRDSFQISQDYYPEMMGKLAVINAPSTFTTIWSVVKAWLAKETAEKVEILGSNYKDVLLDLVDAENLPSSLGGSCTCSEVGGCQLSGAGPWQEGRKGWGPLAKAHATGGDEKSHSL